MAMTNTSSILRTFPQIPFPNSKNIITASDTTTVGFRGREGGRGVSGNCKPDLVMLNGLRLVGLVRLLVIGKKIANATETGSSCYRLDG